MMNIHQAAFAGRNDLIHAILIKDPSQVDQILELRSGDTVRKVTPLFLAVIEGQLNTVQLLLNSNATLDPEGCERLFDWAMLSKERRKVCKMVSKRFANTEEFVQETSLSRFNANSTELKDLLRRNGFEIQHDVANLSYYYWLGETQTLETVQACLKEGDDQFEVAGIFIGALVTGNQPILDYLKEKYQFSIESTVSSGVLKGMNLLALAGSSSNVKAVSILIDRGCNLNFTPIEGSFEGMTLASIAAMNGATNVLRYLRENGHDIIAPCEIGKCVGFTPIAIAAKSGRVEILDYYAQEGYRTNERISSGEHKGSTIVYIAASFGRVNVLEWYKRKGFTLKDYFVLDGEGDSHPVVGAISNGQVEVLKLFKEMGYDLNQSITYGQILGFTCPMLASFKNQVKVLEYFQSIGLKMNEPLTKGQFVNTTPFGTAIATVNRPVMTFFYENGFEVQPELVRKPMYGETLMDNLKNANKVDAFNAIQDLGFDLAQLPIKMPGVKKLSATEQVTIVFYQLQVHESWFEWNSARFLREMQNIDPVEWVRDRSWDEIQRLLTKYIKCGGNANEWVKNALLRMIELSFPLTPEVAKGFFEYVDPSQFQIEDLIDAVKPGDMLLELLKRLSLAEVSYRPDQLMHLEQWISRLLKEPAGDEEFWTLTRNYLKAIRLKVKSKPVQASQRGKGRGPQVKKDALEPLWGKFDKKILEANSKPEVLQAMIAAKHQEVSNLRADLLKDNETFVKKLERKWTISTPSDQDDLLKSQKIQAFLNDLSHESQLREEDKFLQHDFKDFKKVATLEAETSKVASGIIASAKETSTAFQRRFSEREMILEVELVSLENERAFRQLQRKMQQEPRPASLLKPYKNIEKRFQAREDAVWKDHEIALAQANSVQELKVIRQETESRISELAQSLMAEMVVRSQEVAPVKQTRMQRIEEYKDQKIAEQKQEIERLVQEIERLKQTAQRPPSPEKIIPVVEAPLLNRLIKELEKAADDSKPAQDALKMINLRGDILTKVTEIEKFLALFEITYDRTKGSHSTYTDGQTNVVIADHDGDSKDYQIKAALQAVYDKLPKS